MRHQVFSQLQNSYDIAILIKDAALSEKAIRQYYVDPLVKAGITADKIVLYTLDYTDKNKITATQAKACLENVLKICSHQNIKFLYVADGFYFKVLTKEKKIDPNYGYIKDCKLDKYTQFKIILGTNWQSLFFKPDNQKKIDLSLQTLVGAYNGSSVMLGKNVLVNDFYPSTTREVEDAVKSLHNHPLITCDIEKDGLALGPISTFAFAWNKHEGFAFKYTDALKSVMLQFFYTYKGTVIYHNSTFDIKQIIYNLFMDLDLTRYAGAINGLDVMFKSIHDTKILVYLCTNNSQGNELSLKANAFEYTGNYAQENIKDISKIPLPELLKYNLTDAAATMYLYDQYYPKLILENQQDIYDNIMIPNLKVITNMELVGLPLDMQAIKDSNIKLKDIVEINKKGLSSSNIIKDWKFFHSLKKQIEANAKLKRKLKKAWECEEEFNYNSNQHIGELLEEQLKFDITDRTDGGAPSTGKEVLKKLYNQVVTQNNLTDMDLYDFD